VWFWWRFKWGHEAVSARAKRVGEEGRGVKRIRIKGHEQGMGDDKGNGKGKGKWASGAALDARAAALERLACEHDD
jgi:hypothetical protein